MIKSITNTIESAKQAWRGLQALPEVERIVRRATVDMASREAASKSPLDELAASRKHVAALEQQLAAACGGLKVEQERHAETRKLAEDEAYRRQASHRNAAYLTEELNAERVAHEATKDSLFAVRQERDELTASLDAERKANSRTTDELGNERLKLVAVSKALNGVAEERDRLSAELNRYRARYPEESSVTDVVG